LDPRSPYLGDFLKSLHELLVNVVKLLEQDLLEGVLCAELVDFMVNFIVNPDFIIIAGVVSDCIENHAAV
jgi:hypothetical protein